MALTVLKRGGARVDELALRRLHKRMERALAAAGATNDDLVLSLSDDVELRTLNRRFADEDHSTDVLSFSQVEGMALASAGALGDVVISVPTARRQARRAGHSLDDELFHLAVHGMVHLLGYDHATPSDEKRMFGYEAELRAAANARGIVARVRRPRL